jgi:hypothetical protein
MTRSLPHLFDPAARICPENVRELVDLSVANRPAYDSMARLQEQGIAALYNVLCDRPYAYLADEVGMGKTYQALGLAAVVWNLQPTARILFVSPRESLQRKWVDEYLRFFAGNYRRAQGVGDDRVSSAVFNAPLQSPIKFDRLKDWVCGFASPGRTAGFLRHTSFTRPVYLTGLHDADLGSLWALWRDRMAGWGLHDTPEKLPCDPATASLTFNLAFARSLNEVLAQAASDRHAFDLVVVDEAQCLRNPWNQTNQVFHEIFRGRVGKWLFLSATPVHGNVDDIAKLLNRYPDQGIQIPDLELQDLPRLQAHLKDFMIRRQRRYAVDAGAGSVGKQEYRVHDLDGWAVRDVGALPTLAMGLVQKGLVDVLSGRSNRYRIGFLSSFESLHSSLTRASSYLLGPPDDEDGHTDWHHDRYDRPSEREAPDAGFIAGLSADFSDRFDLPLPHPKVDDVVDHIAPNAFGTDMQPGGRKYLVFTRRVSTVEELRDRLDIRYHQAIERRVERCWGKVLDWDLDTADADDAEQAADDPERAEHSQGKRPIRRAMERGGWLFRFRQTFRTTGRNALFFEENWLERLCRAGGVEPRAAAEALPAELWIEARNHARHPAGLKTVQFRAERMRYLALHGAQRHPQAFGLDPEQARRWQRALENLLHGHAERASSDGEPRIDSELFHVRTLWSAWDEVFTDGELALPGRSDDPEPEQLYKRHVVRTLIGQCFRLTDTLIDLFFAGEMTDEIGTHQADVFLTWMTGPDPSALSLRAECAHWLESLRVIVDSCLDGAGKPWADLARTESWPRLYNPMAVVGVTGGSGGHATAIRQFRTPSSPRVIVCTDTLKEGVDLHLFCDEVVHYGVAWTSGDLEQRVGRVDRFFSQIERRLRTEGRGANLAIRYPHLIASLERGQVERVIERQRLAETLMDSPLAGTMSESKEFSVDALPTRRPTRSIEPFAAPEFQGPGQDLVAVSRQDGERLREHYRAWEEHLLQGLEQGGFKILRRDQPLCRSRTLLAPAGRHHEMNWGFDTDLSRYTLTATPSPWPDERPEFSLGFALYTAGKSVRTEPFVRLLVPAPTDPDPRLAIERWIAALAGQQPSTRSPQRLLTPWRPALRTLSVAGPVHWKPRHKASLRVALGTRSNDVLVYLYDGVVRVVAPIAHISDLSHGDRWHGPPTFDNVQRWAMEQSAHLALGFLHVHPVDELLTFGVRLVHGPLTEEVAGRLVQIVAARADAYEAALTGEDLY